MGLSCVSLLALRNIVKGHAKAIRLASNLDRLQTVGRRDIHSQIYLDIYICLPEREYSILAEDCVDVQGSERIAAEIPA